MIGVLIQRLFEYFSGYMKLAAWYIGKKIRPSCIGAGI